MNITEARKNVDKAIYDYMEALGYDADDVDYSSFNELLNDMEELAK